MQNQAAKFTYDNLESQPWCLEWKPDGSKVAVITKDKTIHILDPRQKSAASVASANEGTKAQSIKFLGQNHPDKILTIGFNKSTERQYQVLDERKISQPLAVKVLDKNRWNSWIHWDEDLNICYVLNKGA